MTCALFGVEKDTKVFKINTCICVSIHCWPVKSQLFRLFLASARVLSGFYVNETFATKQLD